MRKRIVAFQNATKTQRHEGWLDLEPIATVEVSTEDPAFPIEDAFRPDERSVWRAAELGEHWIRLIFDQPVSLHRIRLRLDERERERTQEFTLAWGSAHGGPMIQIVRQQWNFSPNSATTELEDYAVDLEGVSVLELTIQPDIARSDAVAGLTSWHVA